MPVTAVVLAGLIARRLVRLFGWAIVMQQVVVGQFAAYLMQHMGICRNQRSLRQDNKHQ